MSLSPHHGMLPSAFLVYGIMMHDAPLALLSLLAISGCIDMSVESICCLDI